MRIRVIAGKYGGRVIEGSGTMRTHPMGERIRGALFNKIADELEGATILDAFAGSGALGIEALSRGAAHVTFIEKDRVAAKIITQNIELLNINDAKVIKGPVASVADAMTEQYDIIFADPPYHDPQFSTVVSLFRLLKPGGLMILSYPGKGEAPTGLEVVVVDDRKYGNAALAFYRKENAQ